MQFYDLHEQTKYEVVVSKPANPEDLSDLFITQEELRDLAGRDCYVTDSKTKIRLTSVISIEATEWATKLVASGKKTLRIDDEDLLVVLKSGRLDDFIDNDNTRFARSGDRICYARQFKRKKTKVTQGDVNDLWGMLFDGFEDKYGCYPSHVPRYDRHGRTFKAFKDIVGWRRVRKQMKKDYVKFYRQVWDNPEEHIK